jgi:hypothetical protein
MVQMILIILILELIIIIRKIKIGFIKTNDIDDFGSISNIFSHFSFIWTLILIVDS